MLSAGGKPPQQQRDHNLPSPPQFQPHGVPMQLLPAPPTMQPTEPRKAPRSIITAADMPHVVQVIQYHFPVTIMLHQLPSHSWRQPSVKPLAHLRALTMYVVGHTIYYATSYPPGLFEPFRLTGAPCAVKRLRPLANAACAMRSRASHTGAPHERLNVDLPVALLDRVRLRLLDPRTGVCRYGTMRTTVIEALNLWLETQR